jgi:RimJ/RimL family protein N-acetyltransferase
MPPPGPLPIVPEVDTTPRPLPARMPIRGQYVTLEPLHRRHIAELWQVAQGADESWTYLGSGPFASAESMGRTIMDLAATHDPMLWAARPVGTGIASGWIALLDIQPKNASIELGNIWFSPRMQRTRAATEAIFLMLKIGGGRSRLRAVSVEVQCTERLVEARRRASGLQV